MQPRAAAAPQTATADQPTAEADDDTADASQVGAADPLIAQADDPGPGFDADAVILKVLADKSVTPDPYPYYRALRERAPVHRTQMSGLWVLSRFEDCRAALRDPRCGNPTPEAFEQGRSILDGSVRRPRSRDSLSMLNLNPPDHTRIRGLVSRAFTPRRVERMRPEVAAMTDGLLDDMGPVGDLVGSLAFPLPANVISAMVGVPVADRDWLRPRVADLTVGLEPTADDHELAAADAAYGELWEFLSELIRRRRAEPADDLLSALVEASDGEDKLSESEVLTNTLLIYAAGFETTTHLLGNMVRSLVAHPDQHERLRADRSLIPSAVEEVLRFDPPVQIDARFVHEDIEVGGQAIRAGESLMTLLGAANRDPAVCDDPERFDVGRSDAQLLSFGSGIHYCLGAALARLEGQVVLERLLERYENWEITAEPPWRKRITLRGVQRLDVAFG